MSDLELKIIAVNNETIAKATYDEELKHEIDLIDLQRYEEEERGNH